ncbi:MAG: DUF3108 domain-containing protein [Oceanicoccus sp.]|uniref:DUF3108 domain-containing protein n=1 Tax=Oceanicoccus sp. TaxID=2691044 RepID=UPI0026371E3E|nr:DUF3108 domain-containing protein [Oceanicoccus sp.]MCP3907538.1 DUF3108 domain-containing protein [Oceanicoccus sp.]MDG1772230.1 DUF3108 domain-containing protein [Oceanicoccus sp.]
MPYWITPHSPLAAINITIRRILLAALLLGPPALANANPTHSIKPYKAIYSSKVKGVAAEVEQTLNKTDNQQWQLRSYASMLLTSIEKKATFVIKGNQLIPLSYHSSNGLISQRNSELVFDTENQTVLDQLHGKEALPLIENTFDHLSFQSQLRLDLLNDAHFKQKTYHLIDRSKLKTYQVKKLGEETITTPLGTFTAVKLEQRRPNKNKYILIWLAKDWDYFLLRIVRIKEGKEEYQIDLKTAELDGQMIKSIEGIKTE